METYLYCFEKLIDSLCNNEGLYWKKKLIADEISDFNIDSNYGQHWTC